MKIWIIYSSKFLNFWMPARWRSSSKNTFCRLFSRHCPAVMSLMPPFHLAKQNWAGSGANKLKTTQHNVVHTSPLTVTPFTVTPRLQWHFWQFPNHSVLKLPSYSDKNSVRVTLFWVTFNWGWLFWVSPHVGNLIVLNLDGVVYWVPSFTVRQSKSPLSGSGVTWSSNISVWIGTK